MLNVNMGIKFVSLQEHNNNKKKNTRGLKNLIQNGIIFLYF